jgi:tetratricopeptide (TPR) repeat protein
MLGAWISGGIEWDVFHHHRATTFMPVDWAVRANDDGSKTVWVGEQERRQRMRWMVGLTLRPGRSSLEATVRLINRTPLPETMLYWANVAVHADSQYQAIFPPSVRIATFHGKTVFTTWPIGSGTYAGGVNYSGVDLSWWKNHPNPTSFFAWHLGEDFSGGYDHGKDAGIVHVGDHRVLIGAKLWEWGPGDAGRLWDSRILTDSDGPYAELMVGAYSDNQPDYSWFAPYGVREFTHRWYPVRGIGGFTNANTDGAVNLDVARDTALVGFAVTSARPGARAVVTVAGRAVLDTQVALDPGHPFARRVPLPPGTAPSVVEAELRGADGASLVRYRPAPPSPAPPLPDPVRAPPAPAQVATNDELVSIGDRAWQINSPSVDPDAYYREALRRDSLDARANLRAGERLVRRWVFDSAETFLRRALDRLAPGYTNPGHTEALYHLGLALRGQGQSGEARDAFARSAWDPGYAPAAFHQLAELSLQGAEWARAAGEAERALAAGPRSDKGHAFKAMALRHLGRTQEAEWVAQAAAEDDPFDFLSRNELVLAHRARGERTAEQAALRDLAARMRGDVESYLDLASDYEDVGLWDEAADVLRRAVPLDGPTAQPYPLIRYHLAYVLDRLGRSAEATEALAGAAALPPDYCFPFRLESVAVLRWALERNPQDARAWYYLGDLLYERQPEEAIRAWEAARGLDPGFALALRNLGWAYRWTRHDLKRAVASYEAASAADPTDGRIALELDQVYELAGLPLETRLAALRASHGDVQAQSDRLAREAIVLTGLGRYDEALVLLEHTHFHVQELAGAVHQAFATAHRLRGLLRFALGEYAGAVSDLLAAETYPENLEVGRPYRPGPLTPSSRRMHM